MVSIITTADVPQLPLRANRSPEIPPPARRRRHRAPARLLVLLAALPLPVSAQVLPQGPATIAGGRIVIGAEASVSVASRDPGYFDYSSYDDNLMRLVRADATASVRVNRRLFLVGDIRVEGASSGGSWRLRPYAAFARFRPWPARSFDVQAGIIPPVFGAFSRRAYASDNPLIGFPLIYQYLTSLRPDALPASADALLAMRGRGWRPRYGPAYGEPSAGLPVMDGVRYQSGVEVHAGDGRPLEASAAVTAGSLSVPAGEYARPGRQVSGRLAVRPLTGLVLGLSASRGPFLASSLTDGASAPSGIQAAIGFDVEFSRGHWLLRTEGIVSRWHLSRTSAPFLDSLGAAGVTAEGRYRILPGLYAAGRFDHLGFSSISGTAGTMPWDAPVDRVEIGAGYSIARNMLLKVAWQENWRDTATTERQRLAAAQVMVWY